MYQTSRRWALLIFVNVLLWGMLSFYQTTAAAPKNPSREPFANSVAQRSEMIQQLKEMNTLLKEQNALLQSGKLKVIVEKR